MYIYTRKINLVLCGVLAAALVLFGCVRRDAAVFPAPAASSSAQKNIPEQTATEPSRGILPPPAQAAPPEKQLGYIEQAAQDVIAKFAAPEMSEYERAKAAFDYIIATTTLDKPLGLDIWRVRGDYDAPPPFVENRALSVLLYNVGMCEDYAAVLTMLLRGLGLEARYVPGLTYAADGSGFVDHAWTVAKIDGVWYHLDCQLEQNITRRGTIRYKYFMLGDATLSGSHRWGQNLIKSGLLTAAQNEELAADFIYEACPQDFPTPPPTQFTSAAKPDLAAIAAAVDAEMKAHGALPPLELNTVPPVFGLAGYPVSNGNQ